MATMDTDMTDADYDIQIDTEPIEVVQAPETTLTVEQARPNGGDGGDSEMPAAYFESLETHAPIPELLNIQGGSQFGPNAPIDYALEHCPERRPRNVRWINDNSVNLEYDNAQDAADALLALTHPDVEGAASLDPQTSRKAQIYSGNPDSYLTIRQANTGDQKQRNAAKHSEYYKQHPQARDRQRPRRYDREEPEPEVFLDYGDEGVDKSKKASTFTESMYDDAPAPRRRDNDQNRRRQPRDVDTYRPGSRSPRESRFGRLRGRSASPVSGEDGRYGFAEESSSSRRYRSRDRETTRRRSRSRSQERYFKRRHSNHESARWERDQNITLDGSGRWAKNSSTHQKADMGNHRRSDAMDETNKGSLLSRMTKDGKPVSESSESRSLASRMTRDEPSSGHGRLANRITRDGPESNYGRLKDDYSAPREDSFQEPTVSRRDLASRITWTRDRGGHDEDDEEIGYNIRGAAPQSGGFSIRGAAGGN
ncbi:hypothetical protein BU24DRAFT_494193 [Aaosphaeria arxii CBS 175.79]|uniref:Uncharacterized protein n=1 Tax=Aaosphaeria arxii CBS 175.79 TaxID=1450172 RepID=A0A6A5XKJ4_9PLEO|nr:uncharacterized protein BU24DRAFT_494193 [Aaosphaeria arxii CBS 175.79]KAF2013785.1 hypothetical protein BU24DRAFT_494193 [Aaosphaeria arxii CBS 175.79]